VTDLQRNDDGTFTITPSAGRRVLDHFIDHATSYMVVRELAVDPADRAVYYTLADRDTGEVLPPGRRAEELSTDEQRTIDAARGLTLATRRSLDPATGAEVLHERLTHTATGRLISSRERSAFAPQPAPTLLETHVARAARSSSDEAFWTNDYRAMPLDERQAWWLRHVAHQLRIQGESGHDLYAPFTPSTYADWRSRDADLDAILDFVLDHLPPDTLDREEFDRRLGRAPRTNG
jgi:hypothetical protein